MGLLLMNQKPIILTFVDYYLPGYKSGGPVRTISNMVDHLADDFDFWIVTRDRDLLETKPYSDILVDSWNKIGKANVYYSSPLSLSFHAIGRLIRKTNYDILYLNSFFSIDFTIKPLMAKRFCMLPSKPVIIAPRGEFSRGALRLSALKKQLFIKTAKILGLYKGLMWHVSSEHEEADIRKNMGICAKNIAVAANLPPSLKIEIKANRTSTTEIMKIAYLSRISPMKNLNFALQVLSQVKVPIEFNVYGLVDNATYWNKCQEQIKNLPNHIKVKYWGVVPHTEVLEILDRHDLFFLPTRGENYGHAIYEALAAGIPVLISDQTPWRDLYEQGVGWVLPLNDMNAYIKCIEDFAVMQPEKRTFMSEAALRYANQVLESRQRIDGNRELFIRAASQYLR